MKKLVKGRSIIGLVAAFLYAACRETGTPKTVTDIANACGRTSNEVTTIYKLILRELSLQMPVLHGSGYIAMIANRLNLSERTKRDALRIYSLVHQNRISIGKNPRTLTGAVIYLALQISTKFVRQAEICQAGDISTVSLRKRCRDIKNLFAIKSSAVES